MKLYYLYPENLPWHRAHDVYVHNNCACLAAAGFETTLCVGGDTLPEGELAEHYQAAPPEVIRLPIIRRSNLLHLSWKGPFYRRTQAILERERPDWVLSSVLDQGHYHWKRKVPGVRYLYEVHQLSYYPHAPATPKMLRRERQMLAESDLVVVTTSALRDLLRVEPYNLEVPVEVVPLGVRAERLPPKRGDGGPVTVAYVGQCYPLQGVELLFDGLKRVPGVRLEIVGGSTNHLGRLRAYGKRLGVFDRVVFHGTQPPSNLGPILDRVDGFVMPSRHLSTNPHVAYTKLYEYASWGRPIIAPNCKAVLDHLGSPRGVLFYKPEDPDDLALCLEHLSHLNLVEKLGEETRRYEGAFSWAKRGSAYAYVLNEL